MNHKSFLKTQPLDLKHLLPQTKRLRTKSTDCTTTLHTQRDYHKKLYLRQFDFGKLTHPSQHLFQKKQYGPSGCTTARETEPSVIHTTRQQQQRQLFDHNEQNNHPNTLLTLRLPRKKLESTIKTTLKDRVVVTNIVNKYQKQKFNHLRI